MIAEEPRTGTFVKALQKVITTDTVVLDIGSGTGIHALLACELGAKKVFAVEPNPLIHLAKDFAAQYGYKNQIEFIKQISTEIELEEKADVLICDLHGNTPFFSSSIFSIIDARKRLLKPDAVLIPNREIVYFAVVEFENFYEKNISRFLNNYYGINMSSAKRLLTNRTLRPDKKDIQLFSESKVFAALDYKRLEDTSFNSKLKWEVNKSGLVHGLLSWFECELGDELKITNSPDTPQNIYGTAVFPFDNPVQVDFGDVVEAEITAKYENGDYTWIWNTEVYSKDNLDTPKAKFLQSTLTGTFLPPDVILKQSEYYLPKPNETAEITKLFLNSMDGEMLLGDIADLLLENFPKKFKSFEEAMFHVSELSRQYSK